MADSIAARIEAVQAGKAEGSGFCVVPILGRSHDEPAFVDGHSVPSHSRLGFAFVSSSSVDKPRSKLSPSENATGNPGRS